MPINLQVYVAVQLCINRKTTRWHNKLIFYFCWRNRYTNSWWWSLIASYLNIFCIKIENIERKSWPDSEPGHCLLVISPFPHHLEKLQYESIVKLDKSKKFGPNGLVISNPKALICYHSAKKTHWKISQPSLIEDEFFSIAGFVLLCLVRDGVYKLFCGRLYAYVRNVSLFNNFYWITINLFN